MSEKNNKRKTGSIYEKRAAEYLKSQGYEIIEMNYRCKSGEIDIVAREDGYLVFVEVKYRKGLSGGLPEEAVDVKKQRNISRVSLQYCLTHGFGTDIPCRFDVLAFLQEEIHLVKNAFEYQGI